MAIILDDVLEHEQLPTPTLQALLTSLQPPHFVPPPHDDRTLVSSVALDSWRVGFERTVRQLELVLKAGSEEAIGKQGEALAAALSRWIVATAAEEQEGWLLDQDLRSRVTRLLSSLPPPTLLSLKPIFQSTPPPQLSTTSFRPLAKPVHNDDVEPDGETWRRSAGWGCWNVLRIAVDRLDDTAAVPIPFLLPPVLTLLDSTHPPTRLRGLQVLQEVIDKMVAASCKSNTSKGWGGEKGKWMKQTGLGEVFIKSLNTSLLLPNSPDAPLPTLHRSTLQIHLSLSLLLYPLNSRHLSASLDELIERGIISIYTYRQGGEIGPDAREIAEWLSEGALWQALGSLGTVRHFGTILPSLFAPFSELSYTARRSRTFARDLLSAIRSMLVVASLEGGERVGQWRGTLLDGLGRLWVAISEAESLPGVEGGGDFEALKGRIGELLKVVLTCVPELSDDLEDLANLDSRMFAGLLALL